MTSRIVTPGSTISPDTYIGSGFGRAPAGMSAEPSTPNPGALVAGNRVSTGTELESD